MSPAVQLEVFQAENLYRPGCTALGVRFKGHGARPADASDAVRAWALASVSDCPAYVLPFREGESVESHAIYLRNRWEQWARHYGIELRVDAKSLPRVEGAL